MVRTMILIAVGGIAVALLAIGGWSEAHNMPSLDRVGATLYAVQLAFTGDGYFLGIEGDGRHWAMRIGAILAATFTLG